MVKINRSLLPIKAHYFFFMAAMGPILPQTNVFGKQLGMAPDTMGLITSVLPILYILAKPAVGYLIDSFANARKAIFIGILLIMTLCFAGFHFVPLGAPNAVPLLDVYAFDMDNVQPCHEVRYMFQPLQCNAHRPVRCAIDCAHHAATKTTTATTTTPEYGGLLTVFREARVSIRFPAAMDAVAGADGNDGNDVVVNQQALPMLAETTTTTTAAAPAVDNNNNGGIEHNGIFNNELLYAMCLNGADAVELIGNKSCALECRVDTDVHQPACEPSAATFWWFVCLMCIGTIGFNVANCVSDATCFDMLGDQTMDYGAQRVWGTIGFGLSALLAGVAVDAYGAADAVTTIAPALIVMLGFSTLDVLSIRWLRLPVLSSAASIWGEVSALLRQRRIVVFLVFATLAGILDAFIIYYMFWHLEEVAARSGHMASIKLIEGCVVAAECLGGEILFFMISGRVLRRIGYVHCMSFCFGMYALRLALISLVTNPWWLVAVEFAMQGPTYALCYTCIVAYASSVAPPGTTATVQGLVAGMDDGIGFAIGSLIGGQAFRRLGGALSFQMFSVGALVIGVLHYLLRPVGQHETMQPQSGDDFDKVREEDDGADVEMSVEAVKKVGLSRPEVKYEAVPQEIMESDKSAETTVQQVDEEEAANDKEKAS